MEKYICNLECAKRLKELGVNQYGGEFYWLKIKRLNHYFLAKAIYTLDHQVDRIRKSTTMRFYYDGYTYDWEDIEDSARAYLTGELGEALPVHYVTCRCDNDNEGCKYICWDNSNTDILSVLVWRANTEADVKANCLIYLLENKLIKTGG